MAKVDEEAAMAKHIYNNLDDQAQVGGGAVLTKMVVQMGVTGGDLTVIYRGGDATHAIVDVVGEVDMIENNTSGDEIPVGDDEGEELFKTNTSEAGAYFVSININVCFR